MKCDTAKSLLMDYLYDELVQENVAEFEQHLQACADCTADLKSLRETQKICRTLPEIEPAERLIFNEAPRKSLLGNLNLSWPRFSFARAGYVAGLAVFVLLVIGSLGNLQIQHDQNGFAVKMSLFPAKTQELTPELQEALLAKLREENQAILANYLQEERIRNEKKLDVMMASYTQQRERQRRNDLQLIGRGLDAVRDSQNSQLLKYQQMIKNVNFPRK